MIPRSLLDTILDQYTLPWEGTHGVSHWARVLENGRRLAVLTGANIKVVELFSVLHDSKRRNEGVDFVHGPEGADYAAHLNGMQFQLSDYEFELLYQACAEHTDGHILADPTVQTCWDADRLDLGRVGIIPRPSRLCTEAARGARMRAWATKRAFARQVPDLIASEWGIPWGQGRKPHARDEQP